MALVDITPTLNIDIDLTQSVPRFVIQDATDYTGQSVTLADVEGNLKIVVNGSATPLYDNIGDWTTPDIAGSSAGQSNQDLTRFRTQGSYISAPLASGDLVDGTYAFTYEVSDDNGTTIVTSTVTYEINYDKATGVIESVVDLNPLSPSLTITDETDYTVDSVTPTISRDLTLYYPPNSTLGGSTTTTSASLSVSSFNVGVQTAKLDSDLTYDLSSKVKTAASSSYNLIGSLVETADALLTSIAVNTSDATNGSYPSISLTGGTGSGAVATVVISGQEVTGITVVTKGSGYVIGDVLEINQAGIGGTTDVRIVLQADDIATYNTTPVFTFDVLDNILAYDNKIEVTSVTSICDLYCCVKDFLTRIESAVGAEKNRLRSLSGQVAIYLEQISNAYACDKGEDINHYVEQLKDLAGCDDNCGCSSGDAPTVIEAIGVGGIPTQNVLHYTGLSSPTTYTEPLLIGSTYETTGNPRRQDFSVFIGLAGQLDQLTAFDSTTGKMTFSGTVTSTFSVIRYR